MFEDLLRLSQQTASTLASLIRRWVADPLLRSVQLEATIPVGLSTVTVAHGLGRAHNGAFVVGASAPYGLTVDYPTDDTTLTIRADAVVIITDLTIRLRVF